MGCSKGFTAEEQESKSLTTFPVPFSSRGTIQGVHFLDDESFVVLSVSALRDIPQPSAEMSIPGYNLSLLYTIC
jgi:hypothetical protein